MFWNPHVESMLIRLPDMAVPLTQESLTKAFQVEPNSFQECKQMGSEAASFEAWACHGLEVVESVVGASQLFEVEL